MRMAVNSNKTSVFCYSRRSFT